LFTNQERSREFTSQKPYQSLRIFPSIADFSSVN
jgi:hypothetical protein